MTQAQVAEVEAFIDAVEPEKKRAEARILDALFREVTGYALYLSGSIIGYGRYHYVYDSGREGDCQATGFSPRKGAHSIYIMPGYASFGHILERIGKHKMGKACLYVNKLADIDQDVLKELIRAGLDDLDTRWPVQAT